MRIAPEIRSAAANAAETVPSHSSPAIEKPDVMASAAPNEAPDVMPRVVGLAKGFAVIVWIRRPASDKAAPTVTAVRAAGSRISRMMKAVGSVSGAKSATSAWKILRSEVPTATSARKRESARLPMTAVTAVRTQVLRR